MKTYREIYDEEMGKLRAQPVWSEFCERVAKLYAAQHVEAQVTLCAEHFKLDYECNSDVQYFFIAPESVENCPRVELK